MRKLTLFILVLALAGTAGPARAGSIENVDISAVAEVDHLEDFVEERTEAAGKAEWLGYQVPTLDPDAQICCNDLWNHRPRRKTCELESSRRGFTIHNSRSGSGGPRYGNDELLVLLRLEEGHLERIRIYSADCPIDAGGRNLTWLDGVDPDQSAALLHRIVSGDFAAAQSADVRENALVALAFHESGYVDGALEQVAAGSQPHDLREEAIFWLGEARGRLGYEALMRLMGTLDDSELREELAFALSLSDDPRALDSLIEMARTDRDSDSRGQALFWLSQTGGPRAAESIMAAARDDASADVREEAIFALSQLPGGEGTQMLIEVARDASFPRETRKEAIFWLGQSNDPRALEVFQEILR